MWIADGWKEYELIDASQGERLERWGSIVVIRPDPQVAWQTPKTNPLWKKAHARYQRSSSGGGRWQFYQKVPESWVLKEPPFAFKVKPMNFKHMGLFPEQRVNWDWFRGLIQSENRPVKVLNLFAYTGGATVAAAEAGASVCHVDASKGMVSQAKENAALSGLGDKPIRYLVDDCMKLVEREIRRGNRYDGIIMDPPSYGRGPGGEVWKIETELYRFIQRCALLLSDRPLFVLLNSYTTGLSAATMQNVLTLALGSRLKGHTEADEIGLPIQEKGLCLSCGASARWTAKRRME
jgi:23S rRNA (cytosine1962-C5)-methyltransferase